MLMFTGTKPQFAYDISEAKIIQNWGFRSTLKTQATVQDRFPPTCESETNSEWVKRI